MFYGVRLDSWLRLGLVLESHDDRTGKEKLYKLVGSFLFFSFLFFSFLGELEEPGAGAFLPSPLFVWVYIFLLFFSFFREDFLTVVYIYTHTILSRLLARHCTAFAAGEFLLSFLSFSYFSYFSLLYVPRWIGFFSSRLILSHIHDNVHDSHCFLIVFIPYIVFPSAASFSSYNFSSSLWRRLFLHGMALPFISDLISIPDCSYGYHFCSRLIIPKAYHPRDYKCQSLDFWQRRLCNPCLLMCSVVREDEFYTRLLYYISRAFSLLTNLGIWRRKYLLALPSPSLYFLFLPPTYI